MAVGAAGMRHPRLPYPRILDARVSLANHDGSIRQISVIDFGHEEPTLLVTNQLRRSPGKLISRYAQIMIIENSIADGIEFFHMDALSSTVAMKVNCDLQFTLMASSLYRLLDARIGRCYQATKAQHIFRDFIDATASVHITEEEILVRFQKRAHNPLCIRSWFTQNRYSCTMPGKQAPSTHFRLGMFECIRVVRSQNTNVGIQDSLFVAMKKNSAESEATMYP